MVKFLGYLSPAQSCLLHEGLQPRKGIHTTQNKPQQCTYIRNSYPKKKKKITSTRVFLFLLPLTQGDTYNCRILDNHVAFLFSFRTETSAALPLQQTWYPWHPTPPTLSSRNKVQCRPLLHNTAVDFANTANGPSWKHRFGEMTCRMLSFLLLPPSTQA